MNSGEVARVTPGRTVGEISRGASEEIPRKTQDISETFQEGISEGIFGKNPRGPLKSFEKKNLQTSGEILENSLENFQNPEESWKKLLESIPQSH